MGCELMSGEAAFRPESNLDVPVVHQIERPPIPFLFHPMQLRFDEAYDEDEPGHSVPPPEYACA